MIDPTTLLPHGPEMHYVRRILERDDDRCRCSARFAGDNPFAIDGTVAPFVAIEAIAQSAAVHEAAQRRDEEEGFAPRIGYLVSASDLVFAARIPVDQDFETEITLLTKVGSLAEYRVRARLGDTVFVEGTMKTFAPDDAGT